MHTNDGKAHDVQTARLKEISWRLAALEQRQASRLAALARRRRQFSAR